MKNRKRILALLLAFVLMLTLIPAMATAEQETAQGTVFVEAYVSETLDISVEIPREGNPVRKNPENAWGEPDALQQGNDDKFTGVRYYDFISYGFSGTIYNNTDIFEDGTYEPDLTFSEVTWGTWHVEAIDVYLLDAVDTDGEPLGENGEYFIGTVFNKVGLNKKLSNGVDGFEYKAAVNGNIADTWVYFPDNVYTAEGLKIVDVTQKYNSSPYSPGTSYNANVDGYDLDAIKAWKVEPTVTKSGSFSIQKMVQTEGGEYATGGDGFTFNAYSDIDDEGNPASEIVATVTTNIEGIAFFSNQDIIPGNTYYVFEEMDAEQSLIYQYGAQNSDGYVLVTADEGETPVTAMDFFNDLIPGEGTLVIAKELGTKVNVSGSITGGYPAESSNARDKQPHNLEAALGGKGNWFQYNEVQFMAAGSEYTFDLVQGDKLARVGEYTIKANGNGTFTVTFPDLIEGVGAKLSISNVIKAAKNKNDKNFNANNIWASSPGQQQFSTGGNSFTVSAPWVDLSQKVYIYLHLDGLTGYADTFDAVAGQTFKVLVTGPSYPDGAEFYVPMNGSITLEGLLPGTYTVKEIESDWKATYYVNGGDAIEQRQVNVEVVNDEVTTVRMKNEQGSYASGAFSIQKILDGAPANIENVFTFEAYAEINQDGNPIGDPIATADTNFEGIAYFESDAFEIGGIYYVFEVMTPEQSAKYRFGAENPNGYVEVTAVADTVTPLAKEFYNETAIGSISGTKWRVYGGNTNLEDAPLSGWLITIEGDNLPDEYERSILTDDNGAYTFEDLPFGTYTVTEEEKDGWLVVGLVSFEVVVGVGDGADSIDVTGINFYNRKWEESTIEKGTTTAGDGATWWANKNGFGRVDATYEELISGVEVHLIQGSSKNCVNVGTAFLKIQDGFLNVTLLMNDGNYLINVDETHLGIYSTDEPPQAPGRLNMNNSIMGATINDTDGSYSFSVAQEQFVGTQYIYIHINGLTIMCDV